VTGGGVTLDYFKWPDRTAQPYKGHRALTLLGEDPHGRWLWCPRGGAPAGADYDSFLTLVPHESWWTATWIFRDDARLKIWVDITTPAVWRTPAHVQTVDLDIDVQLLPDGTVEVLDEDEFAEHAVAWAYPSVVRSAAPAAARFIARALRDLAEPFSTPGERWLALARGDP
jgi:hypothetical protein